MTDTEFQFEGGSTYQILTTSRFEIDKKFGVLDTRFVSRYDRRLLAKKPEKSLAVLARRLSDLMGQAIVANAEGRMKGVNSLHEDSDQTFKGGKATHPKPSGEDSRPDAGIHPEVGKRRKISQATLPRWTTPLVQAKDLPLDAFSWRMRRVIAMKKDTKLVTSHIIKYIIEQRKEFDAKCEDERNASGDGEEPCVSQGISSPASGPTGGH